MPELSEGPTPLALVPPCGLDEICATFGDIFGYIATDHTLDPRWHTEFLDRIGIGIEHNAVTQQVVINAAVEQVGY